MSTRMKRVLAVMGCLLMGVGAAYGQTSGSLQGNLGVSITIGTGCAVNNSTTSGAVNTFGSINFGSYYSLNNAVTATSTGAAGGPIQVQCTANTAYTVSLGPGLYSSTTSRGMNAGVAGTNVNYNLYQDAANSIPWGNGTRFGAVESLTGTGSAQTLNVYGVVPGVTTTPAAGTYSDTVLVTVAW